MRQFFSILCLLLSLIPHSASTAEEFMLGNYRAHVLIGAARLVEGTDYLSFTGDFGFSGWLPTPEAIARHLAHESSLLSNFQLSVINLEHILPGISGRDADRQIDTTVIDILTRAGFDLISRANNHALDYGPEGVRYNTSQWAQAGLPTIGTRDSPVYEWETGGRLVAIYALTAYTDREDLERLVMRIDEADLALVRQKSERADFTIAFVHLGSMSFFPSPHERQQVGRLIDAGADLVVCTGSHFLKGFVVERGKPVVYGIGNHLFPSEGPNTEPLGMHLIAGFKSGELVQLFVVPFWNTILEGKTGPLDEMAFHAFKTTLLERSTTDTAKYFSDPHALAMLKNSLSNFNLYHLWKVQPRHFLYAIVIIFRNFPIIIVLGCLTVLACSFLLLRRMILLRGQSMK